MYTEPTTEQTVMGTLSEEKLQNAEELTKQDNYFLDKLKGDLDIELEDVERAMIKSPYYEEEDEKLEADAERILELRLKAHEEMPTAEGSGMEIAGEAAKNLAKSGNFTATGVTKAVAKAMGKQKKKGILSGMVNGFLDDIGARDIQDEFTEIGNEFREEFGLKTKMTYAEQKELKELEETRKKKELQEQKNSIFQNKVNEKKAMVDKKKKTDAEQKQPNHTIPKMSVKEQMELLQQMKSLLDSGVLTQEEFEQKKQEILND